MASASMRSLSPCRGAQISKELTSDVIQDTRNHFKGTKNPSLHALQKYLVETFQLSLSASNLKLLRHKIGTPTDEAEKVGAAAQAILQPSNPNKKSRSLSKEKIEALKKGV